MSCAYCGHDLAMHIPFCAACHDADLDYVSCDRYVAKAVEEAPPAPTPPLANVVRAWIAEKLHAVAEAIFPWGRHLDDCDPHPACICGRARSRVSGNEVV